MNVRVHIEHLVLDGVPVDRHAAGDLHAAVVAELGRLLAAGPLPPGLLAGGVVPEVRVPGTVTGAPGATAAWGAGIGRALHRGLDGGRP
jgi:hypothetical protein